jgi:hypothetical protein
MSYIHYLEEIYLKKLLKNYIETWKGKHPDSIGLFCSSVNETVGEDLNWFWQPWFYEFGAPDLAVQSVAINGEEALIKVEKVGNLPTTVHITIHYDDGSSEEIKELSSVWKDGNSLITIKHKSNKNINKVVVGNSHIPDIDKSNNTYELKTSQS